MEDLDKYSIPNDYNLEEKREPIIFWKQRSGRATKLTDMTDIHLRNTIGMLRRQVDGSAHDDFVYDNIEAMTNELERRNKMSDKIMGVDLKVVGVTFKNEDGTSRKERILEIAQKPFNEIGVELVREPDNKYDPNAIKVMADGNQIGYIGKDFAMILAPLIDNELRQFGATVKNCGEYEKRPFCEITVDEI